MKKTIIIASLITVLIMPFTIVQSQTNKNESNKEMVLKALKAVFIEGDTSAVDKYWAKDYIQHNPMFPNGSDIIKQFAKNKPQGFKFEPGLVMEDGEFVMVHSRYSGMNSKSTIVVDILRVKNGKIVEHWDIIQDEVPASKSVNGNAMFPIEKSK